MCDFKASFNIFKCKSLPSCSKRSQHKLQSVPKEIFYRKIKNLTSNRPGGCVKTIKDPRPIMTEEDKIAKQSLFLVPSTFLFHTLARLNIIEVLGSKSY